MSISRRRFLSVSYKSLVVISASNLLKVHPVTDYALPPDDGVKLRFAIASDGHYGQAETNYDLKHDEMVHWLNAEKAGRGISFSFINGDLFHDDASFLTTVKGKWDGLKMPYYVSHGNHDKIDERTWQQTFKHPWHYSFEQNSIPFIVLNTADVTGKYICPDIAWAEKELNRYAAAPVVLVFMHITPFKWTTGGIDCPKITALFEKHPNVKAIFHGHDHDQDAAKEHNGKHYFFDSHIAGNWGTAYRGYRIVEVLKDGTMISYQMNPKEKELVNKNQV